MSEHTGPLLAASLFFRAHLNDCLAAAILFSRAADVLSTRFATPNLRLEANPLVRKLGWPFAWATLALCIVPYAADSGSLVAVPIVVMSLLVASGNVARSWAMRTLGEEAYVRFMRDVYASARPAVVYGAIAVSSALVASAGGFLLLFYPEPDEWGFYFAQGLVIYGVAMALHSSFAARRMFRETRAMRVPATATAS